MMGLQLLCLRLEWSKSNSLSHQRNLQTISKWNLSLTTSSLFYLHGNDALLILS